MTQPTVIAIQLHKTEGQPLLPVTQARALSDRGLEGDSHSQGKPGGKRQVLILDESTLEHFGLEPGALREQLTIRGWSDVSQTTPGTQIRIGDVTFEAVGDCAPCLYIGELLGVDDAEAFRQALQGRRGLLCRVAGVEGEGFVRLGDPVFSHTIGSS